MPPRTESTDAPPPAGIPGTNSPRSTAPGSEKVSAAQAMIEKNMVAISTFMTFSNPVNPPSSTSAPPAIECATAPQDRGIAPLVSVAIPRPEALVSAALTDTVQMTR